MTLTLYGRWQTRLLLMTLLGVPITIAFAFFVGAKQLPFILLGYAMLFGFGWDLLYNALQCLRWNRDWPPFFAFVAGLWEGAFLFAVAQIANPLSPEGSILLGLRVGLNAERFWLHYGLVFAAVFLTSLGLLHILMPRWRYRGGQWM